MSKPQRVELGDSVRNPRSQERERMILANFDTGAPVASASRSALFEPHPNDPSAFYAAYPVGDDATGYRSSGYTGVVAAPEKEIDCVLIWNAQSQTFKLERVDQTIQFTPDRSNPPLLSIPNLNPPVVLPPQPSHSTPQNAAESSDEEIRVASVPPKHLRKQARRRSSLIPAGLNSVEQAMEEDDDSMEIMEEVPVAARPAASKRLPEREDFGNIVMHPAAAPSTSTVNLRTISLKMAERPSSPASSNGRLPTPMRIASPALTLSVAPTPAPTPPPRTKPALKGGAKPVIRPPIKPASKKVPAKPKATKAPSKTTAAALAGQSTANGPPKKRAKRDSLPGASIPLPPVPKIDVAPRAKPIVPMGRGPPQSQHHSQHPPPSSGSDESSDDDESDDDDNTGLPEGYLAPTALGRRNTLEDNSESEEEDDVEEMEFLEREINAGMGSGGKGKGRRRSSAGSLAHKSTHTAAASKRPAAPPVVRAPVAKNPMALSRMMDTPVSSEEE